MRCHPENKDFDSIVRRNSIYINDEKEWGWPRFLTSSETCQLSHPIDKTSHQRNQAFVQSTYLQVSQITSEIVQELDPLMLFAKRRRSEEDRITISSDEDTSYHANKKRRLLFGEDEMSDEQRRQLAAVFPAANLSQVGDTACITIPLAALTIQNRRRPVYHDVQGPVPAYHPDLGDVDMYNEYLEREDLEQELARARLLSQKPIGNAPHYLAELPWDEMKDITIEELIIYFPNHVFKWPGLALLLRMNGWDQLFQRTAALINRARGSQYHDRDFRHAEALPCMMKVEKAIQEIEPHYTLAEHEWRWAPMITSIPEWVQENHRRKPRSFDERTARVVTLEEIASYVVEHDFDDRPFSQRVMRAANIVKQRKVSSSLVRQALGYDQQSFGHDQPQQSFKQVPEPKQKRPSRERSSAGDMDMTDTGDIADEEDNVVQSPPPQKICRKGTSCTRSPCKFLHPEGRKIDNRQPKQQAGANQSKGQNENAKQPSRVCRDDPSCKNRKCIFEHPKRDQQQKQGNGPRNQNQNQNQNQQHDQHQNQAQQRPNQRSGKQDSSLPQSKEICRYGDSCTRRDTCFFSHPSDPKSNLQPKQPKNQNGPPLPPPKKVCPHSKCKNLNCTLGHTSPAAPPGASVRLDQGWCIFKLDCTNKKCERIHPSPAGKIQGGRGGGRGDKQNGGGGGKGNGNQYQGGGRGGAGQAPAFRLPRRPSMGDDEDL